MSDFVTFVTALINNYTDTDVDTVETPSELCVVSSSADETVRLGAEIGARLAKGAVIALQGGLGAGKTCFAGGIARALGVCVPVTSPTYTIVNEYAGAFCSFYHIDAYRLSGAEDFFGACGSDFFDGEGIYLVEWPENIAESLPPHTQRIEIRILENNQRAFCLMKR
jgi:tRNA threonylcarbamoyladenosine biosynthesis protein TsaE